MAKKNFYAVAVGKKPGIYTTWPECKAQTNGFKGAVFKGFATRREAEVFVSTRGRGGGDRSSRSSKNESSSSSNSSSLPYCQRHDIASSAPGCRPQPRPPDAAAAPGAPDGPSGERRLLEGDRAEVKQSAKRRRLTTPPRRRRVSFVVHFDGGSRGNPGRVAGAGAEIVMRQVDEGGTNCEGGGGGGGSASSSGVGGGGGAGGDGGSRVLTIQRRKFLRQPTNGGGKNTNNVAEYEGLILGLREATQRAEGSLDEIVESGDSHAEETGGECRVNVELSLRVFGDSQLVINQMLGCYECRSANIRPLYEQASGLVAAWHRLREHSKSKHSLKMDISSTIRFEHVYRKDNATADRLANEAMNEERSWTTVHESGSEGQSEWV